ncbi:MAG: M6 family metalloprotease domain-containing protein [Alloprevotella sp.]|nr:M6 family metalloprotease domain-containing protein [Alloprevotella sp.]
MRAPLLLLTILFFVRTAVHAVPADSLKRVVVQPDGSTLTVRLFGDEHRHCYLTSDGHPVFPSAKGFCYARVEADSLSLTSLLAHEPELRPQTERDFLQGEGKRTGEWLTLRHRRSLASANAIRSERLSTKSLPERPRPYSGKKRGLVILVNFSDLKMTYTQADFDAMFNEKGYSFDNAIGSVSDYFRDQSYGQFEVEFDVVGPVTTANGYAYYGRNTSISDDDANPHEMVLEACKAVDKQVDFSQYDWDGDGEVEQVFLIYAGYGESNGGPSDTIWPHESQLRDDKLTLDGVTINTYACSCELDGYLGKDLDGIGTACHEFSHCLGFPDLYDVEYSGGVGMAYWDVMNSGGHSGPNRRGEVPCGYSAGERWAAGWLEPVEITSTQHIADLPGLGETGTAYVLYNPTNSNELFLLENRQSDRWFSYTREYRAQHGLLITHVDYHPDNWRFNAVNKYPSHQRYTYVPADGLYGNEEDNLAGDLFPGAQGVTAFTNDSHKTTAGQLFTANTDGKFNLNRELVNIAETEAGLVSFDVIFDREIWTPQNVAASLPEDGTVSTSWTKEPKAEAYYVEQEAIGMAGGTFKKLTQTYGPLTQAEASFPALVSAGTVRIRVKAEGLGVTTAWSEWTKAEKTTAIAPVAAPGDAAKPRYFTPDGVEHSRPQPGLNLVRQGDRTRKVVVKP